MKSLLLLASLLFTLPTLAANGCPDNYPNGRTLSYSDGSMNYESGRTLRYKDGSMNYPNGRTLRYADSSMNYENGRTLRYADGSMNFENGRTLRYKDGSLNNENGSTNSTGSVVVSTSFDQAQMRIVVTAKASRFQTTVPFGSGIMILEFDESGAVTCTVEGGSGPSQFQVDGSIGSAYVTVKAGQNVQAVKAAVQKALDGN